MFKIQQETENDLLKIQQQKEKELLKIQQERERERRYSKSSKRVMASARALKRASVGGGGGGGFRAAVDGMVGSRIASTIVTRRAVMVSTAELRENGGEIERKGGAQKLEEEDDVAPRAAYVHIPFCKRRCFYCDFPIHVVGSARSTSAKTMQAEYVDLLLREIRVCAAKRKRRNGRQHGTKKLTSVFFGGGTPSLLPATELSRIVDGLRDAFGLMDGAEISIEADPGTFDADTVAEWARIAKISRVSVGIQSFDDKLLQSCGRSHDAAQARRAAETLAHGVDGITSWSLDLLSGLPGLDAAGWERTLRMMLTYRPPHVSIYDLQVESGTAFGKWYEPGLSPLPSDDDAADMFRRTSALMLDAGYQHYEISSFARTGHMCAHNLTYWRNDRFLGFGVGATSFEANARVARPRTIGEYKIWLDAYEAETADENTAKGAETDAANSFVDELICRTRLREPYHIEDAIKRVYGRDVWHQLGPMLSEFEARGLVECTPHENEHGSTTTAIRLTDPEGFLLSNEVLSSILTVLPDDDDDINDDDVRNDATHDAL